MGKKLRQIGCSLVENIKMFGFPLNSANAMGFPRLDNPAIWCFGALALVSDLATSVTAPMNSMYQMLGSWVDSIKGKTRCA